MCECVYLIERVCTYMVFKWCVCTRACDERVHVMNVCARALPLEKRKCGHFCSVDAVKKIGVPFLLCMLMCA